MTNTQQRIAIAEACGYDIHNQGSGLMYSIPDYPNDLNAMHGAEGFIIGAALAGRNTDVIYARELSKVNSTRPIWHSTAAQRAEAFLRTIGKWKE